MPLSLPLSDTPRVSIVIVAASAPTYLASCLRALERNAPATIPFETIVVLNEWPAAAEAGLRAAWSGIRIVASPVNLGLAGAGNRGRSLARGEYLILLHDDAEVEPGWMEALIETADTHPEAGAIGGKVLHPDGRLQGAGGILWSDATTARPWSGKTPPATAFDTLRAVDFCGTSSLLIRTTAWDAIGGLEERIHPLYYVDVDLSMALRQLGFAVLYQPRSRIRHHQGVSSDQRFRRFATERNRAFFIEKWRKALEQQRPRGSSQTDIDLAIEAAQAFAVECRRQGPPRLQSQPRFLDPSAHERFHYELNRDFQRDYIAHLTTLLDARETGLFRLHNLRLSFQRTLGILRHSRREDH
jgi:GT2 family glycosyltransferase